LANPSPSSKTAYGLFPYSISGLLSRYAGSAKDSLTELELLFPKRTLRPITISPLQASNIYTLNKWEQSYNITHLAEGIAFIHIGKCGGTSIRHSFMARGIYLQQYHLKRPSLCLKKQNRLFIWIRNPLRRFISAFNHAKEVVEFDPSQNCLPAPTNTVSIQRLRRKLRKGYAYSTYYDSLIKSFESANALAESLSSVNQELKRLARELMLHREEHLYKGIGWHLVDGKLIDHDPDRIIFVGRVEAMAEDFSSLLSILGLPEPTDQEITPKRENKSGLNKNLSDLSIRNLRNFYKDSDYKALDAMRRNRLIDEETFSTYATI
jgi:hypothetical protein